MEVDVQAARSKPRTRTALIVSFGVLVVVFLVFWFLIPPTTTTGPVTLQKDAAGNWQQLGTKESAAMPHLEAHAGSLKSTNDVSTSTVTSHTSTGYFASRHVMILNPSDHVLMRRIGDGLIEQLRESGTFNRVDYFPHGHDPPIGELSPDLFVVLGLGAIDESGMLTRELKATVVLTLGTAVAHSNYSVSDSFSPPTLNVFAHSAVDHTSSAIGVESSGAKYRLQGADIAERIGKTIVETINDLREKYDGDYSFPKSLYPDWRPPPTFEFLQNDDCRMMTSLRGLCFHNETFWEFVDVRDVAELTGRVHEELSGSGWEGKVRASSDIPPQPLRMTKGSEVLEVFPARDNSGFRSSVAIVSGESEEQPPRTVTVYVGYRNSISAAARHEAFTELLADANPDLNQLIVLKSLGSPDQQRRLLELIRESPPQLPEAWMLLARDHALRKQVPELQRALQNAHALSWCLGNTDRVDRHIKSLCRKHKLDHKEIRKVDFERISSLGLPTVTEGMPASESTIGVGESTVAVVTHEGDWQVISVQSHGVHKNGRRVFFDTTVSRSGPNGRSSLTGVEVYTDERVKHLRFGKCRATASIKQADGDSLRVRIGIAVN